MSRLFYHVMQDNVGNLLFDVSGTMRLAGTGTLATIYGDEALTAILPNPMTNHPSYGSFKCFLGAGDYDFYMAKSGYTFETLTGVQGHGTLAQQDANAVTITGGTAQLNQVGIGIAPQGGHVLDTVGQCQFNSPVGIEVAPLAGTSLRLGSHFRCDGGAGIGIAAPGGTNLAIGGAITTATTITVTSNGFKPGGGAWGDSSSRALKRQIAPIVDALGLLLAQQGRVFEWEEPTRAAALPGPRYGLIAEEVTLPQWHCTTPEGAAGIAAQGFESLCIEALRQIVHRLEALEARG